MNGISDIIPNLPPPKFLNLEYVYARLFTFLEKLLDFVLWLIVFLFHPALKTVLLVISFVFLILSAVIFYKLFFLKKRKKIRSFLIFSDDDSVPKARFNKWKDIKHKAESNDAEERKSAVIEADSILASIFDGMGFKANGLEEKLKSVEPSDFLSMQDAWEANKIRIKIIDPSFELNKEAAKSAVEKYEKGLKEIGYL